jgi:site-specific recombinase XerD
MTSKLSQSRRRRLVIAVTIDSKDIDISAFRQWLAKKGLRLNTLKSYNLRIESFVTFWCEQTSDNRLVSKANAADYIQHLSMSGASNSTIRQALAAIAYLFEYAEIPMPNLDRPSYVQAPQISLSHDDIEKFLRAAQTCGSLKARTIALLCFYADLSAGQCLALQREDIILESQQWRLYVRKSNKPRELFGLAKDTLLRYLSKLPAASNGCGALFLNDQGERITRSGVDYLIKSVGFPEHLVLSARLLSNTGRSHAVFWQHYQDPRSSELVGTDMTKFVELPVSPIPQHTLQRNWIHHQ